MIMEHLIRLIYRESTRQFLSCNYLFLLSNHSQLWGWLVVTSWSSYLEVYVESLKQENSALSFGAKSLQLIFSSYFVLLFFHLISQLCFWWKKFCHFAVTFSFNLPAIFQKPWRTIVRLQLVKSKAVLIFIPL